MSVEKRDVLRDIDRLLDRVSGLERRVRVLEQDKEMQPEKGRGIPASTTLGGRPK